MTNFNALKKAEHAYQNTKYSKIPLARARHKTSIEQYERQFLTPIQSGGPSRGQMFGRTVQKLLSHDIRGKKVLDYCCGKGDLGVYLAMQGAEVSGIDVSEEAINIANYKAKLNQVHCDFQVMDAEHLRFPDATFDYVIGLEALHHVIIYPKVASELARVLQPRGRAYFAENWGGDNPLFQLWRNWTSLRRANSSQRGEVILSWTILHARLEPIFCSIEVEPQSFLYMSKKYLRIRPLLSALNVFDGVLIRAVPFMGRLCGESVISLQKPYP